MPEPGDLIEAFSPQPGRCFRMVPEGSKYRDEAVVDNGSRCVENINCSVRKAVGAKNLIRADELLGLSPEGM